MGTVGVSKIAWVQLGLPVIYLWLAIQLICALCTFPAGCGRLQSGPHVLPCGLIGVRYYGVSDSPAGHCGYYYSLSMPEVNIPCIEHSRWARWANTKIEHSKC